MNRRRLFDLAAVMVLLGYIWLAQDTESGAADPVWRRIQARGTITVATDIGYAPFVYLEPDGSYAGYDVTLLTEIARRLDLEIEWQHVGYDALFSTLDPGNPNQVDLLAAGVALNPAEGWRAQYTSAYFDNGPQVLTLPDAPYQSQADLHAMTIAVQLGSPGETAARRLAAADPTIRIDNSALTQDAAVEQMLQGKADAAIVESVIALPYINREQARAAAGLEFEPFVFAVPAGAYQFHAELNRVIEQLHQEGWIPNLNAQVFR